MKIVKDKIEIAELKEMSKKMFGNLVKAVVDIEKEIMAVDGALHSDEVEILIENGSKPENLWGINIYPDMESDDFIEFDSVMNIKPAFGNRSRGVDNKEIKDKIVIIVNKLLKNDAS